MRLAVQQGPKNQGYAYFPNSDYYAEQLQALVLQLISFCIQLHQTGV